MSTTIELFAELAVSTGALQGFCLGSKLFSLCAYNCVSAQDDDIIIKYSDDMTILGLISGRDESSCRDLVQSITVYSEDNDFVLNMNKTDSRF